MTITVHKGTHEIGGTCIEIKAENGKAIWLDLGAPLDENTKPVDYRKITPPNALLISHPHKDHYGLAEQIGNNVKVYLGKVTHEIIKTSQFFCNKGQITFTDNIEYIEAWKDFSIEDTFKVTPYLMDHSAVQAFAFLIECDNKRIFYTGDFRATGHLKKTFDILCKDPPKNIDIMFIEGTTIERNTHKYPDEKSIEDAMTKIFNSQANLSFVSGAGQNVARVVATYKACKKSQKTLVLDPYTAYILEIASKHSKNLEIENWDNINIFDGNYIDKLRRMGAEDFIKKLEKIPKVVLDEVSKHPENYVYYRGLNGKFVEHIHKCNSHNINIIYSMWHGYLEKEDITSDMKLIQELREKDWINYTEIHTSGHATRDAILKLVQSIEPKKVVPIHTPDPIALKNYLEGNNISYVEVWDDNKIYIVGA